MSDAAEQMTRALSVRAASRRESTKALWKMTPEQRVSAMRRGELTWWQLCQWAKRAPHEVPLLNGEFEFIAAFTPEVAEPRERQRR